MQGIEIYLRQQHTTNTAEPEMSLPRLLAVLKIRGWCAAAEGLYTSWNLLKRVFIFTEFVPAWFGPFLIKGKFVSTFPFLWRLSPEMLVSFVLVKQFLVPLDPIPLKLRIPDDIVALRPCKRGFSPQEKLFFFCSSKSFFKSFFSQ